MQLLVGLVSGLIFGLGLSVSGMLNPVKVSAFLDIAGAWDPSLALVMGGGLAVNLLAMWLLKNGQSLILLTNFRCHNLLPLIVLC